jgi:hypothetical protein
VQVSEDSTGFRARARRAPRALAAGLAVASLLLCSEAVHAAPAPGGTVIRNVASATYVPAGFAQTESSNSNGVEARVLPVEALALTQDQSVNRPPATVVTLSHLLTNTGNVPSRYTLAFANNAGGCAVDTLDLAALRVVRDLNNNGVVDAADPVLALGVDGALALTPGETAALLVQGTVPATASGSACVALGATTALQNLSATNRDLVTVGDVAVLSLVKSASYPTVPCGSTTCRRPMCSKAAAPPSSAATPRRRCRGRTSTRWWPARSPSSATRATA